MKYQKGFVIPLLLTLLALILVGGGIYVFLNKNPSTPIVNNVDNDIATTTGNISSASSSISTVGWLTYTSKYGFSLQYPSGWMILDNTITTFQNVVAPGIIVDGPVRYDIKESNGQGSYFSEGIGLADNKIQADSSGAFFVQIHQGNFEGEDNIDTPNGQPIQDTPEYQITQKIIQTIKFSSPTSTVTSSSNAITLAGMSQYTDSAFGFSFWYPSSWSVQPTSIKFNPFTGGTVAKVLTVASSTDPNGSSVTIYEFTSSDKSITDGSGCGPADGCGKSLTYLFNSSTHTWMQQQYTFDDTTTTAIPANVSTNTMGGLHLLYGNARFGDDVIVPLSAEHFLAIYDTNTGTIQERLLANTITATDPSVATPVSVNEQIQTIRKEGVQYGGIGTAIDNGAWFIDSQYVYDSQGNILPGVSPSTFKTFKTSSDGSVSAASDFATDGTHVYSEGYTPSGAVILQGADPATFVMIRQQYQIPYAKDSGSYGQSFTSYDTTYEKDKSHVWDHNRLVPGADPNTFVVTGNMLVTNATGGYTLAHDANHVYGEDSKNNVTVDGVSVQE